MKKLLTILFICFAFVSNAQTVSITSSASGSICAGTSVTFTATPSGYSTPSYQWYKNEIAISGETGATYTTTSLTNNDLIYVTAKDLNPPSGGSITTNGLIVQLDASDPTSYTSGTTWTDKKGNANSAINGAVSYVSNGSASYFSFPGANNDYIKSSLNQAIKDFTIVFQPDFSSFNYSGGHTLFSKGPGVDYSLRFWSYNFSGLSNPNASVWGAPNLSTNPNDWLGTNSLFLNGVNNQTGFAPLVYGWNVLGGAGGTNGSGFGNFPYCLGAGAAGRSFQGKIAVVLFYDRTLTSAEQQQNFDALKSRFAFASNAIITNVNASPSIPTITVTGDACVNKTILNTTSGLSSYSWTKNNLVIAGAATTTYSPNTSGDYKVVVSNGTCSTASAPTTINTCGVTADGKMVSVANSGSLLSSEGGSNFGTTMDEVGKILNTTGLTTTTGTIGSTTAVLGGVISASNAVTSSIGVIYSTDANFGTSSSSTIQSNVVAGAYTTTITGLSSSTNYYAKSFVVNKAGTSFGPVVSFTTPAAYVAPIITTTGLVLNLDAAHPDSYAGSGTAWTDVSNNNNSVTLPSVIASSYSATTGGGSFTFNSNNAINKFSSTSINNWNINTTNAISVETWIKYTSNGGLQFYFQDDAINYRFGFDQAAHFYYDLGAHSDRNPSTATLTANTWHHLVITAGKETANGNRVKSRFYIDGAEVYSYDEGISSLPNITTPYHIGDDPYHYFPLNGNIGVIRVYNTALSQAEITLNFNAQKARFGL